MKWDEKKGISLIVLVITIVVVLILAVAIILSITKGGVLDSAKKARFMSDFRSVEDGVSLYSMSKIDASNLTGYNLPTEGKLNLDDKIEITRNVPTLKTKMEELNPGKTLNDLDLFWINEPVIGANLSSAKKEKGYIIDSATNQIYDYVGDVFEDKRWHTLDGGITEMEKTIGDIEELWNGWIRLTLYYPKNSTAKQWRLGTEGELRADPMLMWQGYTGPITIPLDRTKDVWIKYKINNKEVTIPPAGTLLVDIIPDSTGTTKVSKVNVRINYDESAIVKEYRVANSGWMPYIGPFDITENCVVEARAKKTENVYNTDGSLLLTRDVAGSDKVYIGNIGVSEPAVGVGENNLVAPTIERLPAVGSEKARVRVTYPANATKKIYTINNGAEQGYTQDINVDNWGTYVVAYYYDASGNRSKATSIMINEVATPPTIDPPIENLPGEIAPAPTITRLASVGSEKARARIDYPANAVKRVYVVNYGQEQEYTGEVSVNEWGTNIIAYYYDASGKKSKATSIIINDTTKGQTPEVPKEYDPTPSYPLDPSGEPKTDTEKLPLPTITRLEAQNSTEKARVKIDYPAEAVTKIYTINHGVEQKYVGEVSINEWDTTVIAYYYDAKGNKSEAVSILINDTSTGETPKQPEAEKPKTEDIQKVEPAPVMIRLDAQNTSEKARVKIYYPANAVKRIYKINNGQEQGYSSEISITTWGTNVVAYYYDANGNMSKAVEMTINDTSTGEVPKIPVPFIPDLPLVPGVPKPEEPKTAVELPAPTIERIAAVNSDEKARVKVTYPASAARKVYTINYGAEIEYTSEIPIYGWGSDVMAYYYDADGNRSKVVTININDTTNGQDGTQDPAKEDKPQEYPPLIPNPADYIAAPIINISPTSITNEVTATVTTPADANKTYIKIGRYGEYKEYIGAEKITENLEIFAYYRTASGEKSVEAMVQVDNIKKAGNKPYLAIDALPYPWSGSYGATDVLITLKYSSADKVEYSEDGITYKVYTAPFKVTQNERVYARATNSYGITEANLDITNIGQLKQPKPMEKLAISINANPDPILSTTKFASVNVSIEYESLATEKYYSIGKYGELKTYTGPFTVTSNCTIYAYAKGTNAKGEATKTIDNLLSGISDPLILTDPISSKTASKVTVSIQYDKYATVKKYSVDGGTLQDYTAAFEITKNNTVVYAYSENAAGQKSEATYTIQNIIPEPPILILDKGAYYIVKLNYPLNSISNEYKWKENGEWKNYKQEGILLVKPQYKDQIMKNGVLIKLEDENGNKVDFKGDYYLIDVPISELFENISMRWDRTAPKAPQIVINPTETTKSLIASIIYEDGLLSKQYRILEPGGVLGEWQDYRGPITIDRNNTMIYARGMDDSEVWSLEGSYKVTNIDEISPTINVTADIATSLQKVSATINVTDNFEVSKVKWAKGTQGESYFQSNGTEIVNNSIVEIIENGYYTFYAEDKVGNTQVYTLNVQNVDRTAPTNPTISATQNGWTNSDVMVTIAYPSDSNKKEYSLDGTNWLAYTSTLNISVNNTTVYARAIDIAENQSGQSTLTIANIDKTAPTVVYTPNGGSNLQVASTSVLVNDLGGSSINATTLQYIWDTQNTSVPAVGWTSFTNGSTITKTVNSGSYYLWVKATDNAGNIITTKSSAFVIDSDVPENPTLVASPVSWTNGNVTVTITYPTDAYIKEYSLDGTIWHTYTSGVAISINNTTVYARCKDAAGNQSGQSTLTVANIDRVTPTATIDEPSSNNIYEGDTVTFQLHLSDDASGINPSTINVTAVKTGVTSANVTVTGTGNDRTITVNNIWGAGNFYIQISGITDNAGNTISAPIASSVIYVDKSVYFDLNLFSPMDYRTIETADTTSKLTMNAEQTNLLNQVRVKDGTTTYSYAEKDSNNNWSLIGYTNGDLSNNYYYYKYTIPSNYEGSWTSGGWNSNRGYTSYRFDAATGKFYGSGSITIGSTVYYGIDGTPESLNSGSYIIYMSRLESGVRKAYTNQCYPNYQYQSTIIAPDGTYSVSWNFGDTVHYAKLDRVPNYQIYKYENATTNLLSKYNIGTNVLASTLINLSKVQSSVKINVTASSTNYNFYISTDNVNWTEITDKATLNGTTIINLPSASDKMYIKSDNINTIISNIKVIKAVL